MTTLIQNNFSFFLKLLYRWIEEQNNVEFERVALSLDNWTSHRSKEVKQFLQNCDWNIFYLSPYSPQMAPVELAFNEIKRWIRWKSKKRVFKFNKTDGFNDLAEIILAINQRSVMGYYNKFYQLYKSIFPFFITKKRIKVIISIFIIYYKIN